MPKKLFCNKFFRQGGLFFIGVVVAAAVVVAFRPMAEGLASAGLWLGLLLRGFCLVFAPSFFAVMSVAVSDVAGSVRFSALFSGGFLESGGEAVDAFFKETLYHLPAAAVAVADGVSASPSASARAVRPMR